MTVSVTQVAAASALFTPPTRPLVYVVNAPATFLLHRRPVAEAARRAGYTVHVVTPEGPGREEIEEAGFEVHLLHLDRGGLNPLAQAAALWRLHSLFHKLQPCLVHQATLKPLVLGTLAARWARVPAVVNAVTGVGTVFLEQGVGWRLARSGISVALRAGARHPNLACIFQNEEDLATYVSSRLVREEQSLVIRGSGVDLARFPVVRASAEPTVIIFPARLLRQKGVVEFIAAARALRAKGVSARFALVGDIDVGNASSLNRADLDRVVAEGSVEWWGWRKDMAAAYAQSHVVCLPSYGEGTPRSLLEAAASGLAIVTTNVAGCRQVVDEGAAGLLVPVRDVPALTSALEQLVADEALRAELGRRARAHVAAHYSAEQVARETLEVYERLLRSSECS